MERLQIFKPGRHTAMSGATLSFSESDLAATAHAYDPALHEAPIVVGHPQVDGPAYGWVKSLAVGDGVLSAEPNQVDPAFAEMVAAGRFKKISASFYLPHSENNPVPGVHYLRHVGFLGAQAPAVKGLKNASFAASEKGFVEFGDMDDLTNASTWRSLRDWMISKFGLDEADKAVPGFGVDNLQASAAQPEPDESAGANAAYAESQRSARRHAAQQEIDMDEKDKAEQKVREDKLTAENKRLAGENAQFAERDKVVKAQEATARRAGIVSYVEGLVSEGRALPVNKEGLISLLAGLPAESNVEFGEGENAVKQTQLVWLKSYLAAQPKLVAFGEAGADKSDIASVEFSAPPGYQIDRDRLEIHGKALAYAAKNKVDYVTAVHAVGGAG
jgi:hypothetical protein